MEYITLVLFLVFAAGAYYLYSQRLHLGFGYAAAVMVLVAGTVVMVQGMEVPQGQTVTKNITETYDNVTNETHITGTVQESPDYTEISPLLTRVLSLSMIFVGLHLMFAVREDLAEWS